MTGCGCQMGRQGNKDRKGLTIKKKQRLVTPKGFCSFRNETKQIDSINEWEKWKEKMHYETRKYEFKISEMKQSPVRTRPEMWS